MNIFRATPSLGKKSREALDEVPLDERIEVARSGQVVYPVPLEEEREKARNAASLSVRQAEVRIVESA